MERSKTRGFARTWDGAGMAVSGLCVLHCVLPPVLAGVLPAAGWRTCCEDRTTHWWFLGGAAATGLLAFGPAAWKHRRLGPLGLALVAYALLFAAASLPFRWLPRPWEPLLPISGGVLLILAHGLNFRTCRRECTAPSEACGAPAT
jgi:hypothetical protein